MKCFRYLVWANKWLLKWPLCWLKPNHQSYILVELGRTVVNFHSIEFHCILICPVFLISPCMLMFWISLILTYLLFSIWSIVVFLVKLGKFSSGGTGISTCSSSLHLHNLNKYGIFWVAFELAIKLLLRLSFLLSS